MGMTSSLVLTFLVRYPLVLPQTLFSAVTSNYVSHASYSGHFYFTKLLLPLLVSTAKSTPDKKARVVNTSSSMHLYHGLKFNTFKDSPARKKLGTQMLYAQSKFVRPLIVPTETHV